LGEFFKRYSALPANRFKGTVTGSMAIKKPGIEMPGVVDRTL